MKPMVTGDDRYTVAVWFQANGTVSIAAAPCVEVCHRRALSATDGLNEVVTEPEMVRGKDREERGHLFRVKRCVWSKEGDVSFSKEGA